MFQFRDETKSIVGIGDKIFRFNELRQKEIDQSAGAIEDLPTRVLDMTLNNLMMRLH